MNNVKMLPPIKGFTVGKPVPHSYQEHVKEETNEIKKWISEATYVFAWVRTCSDEGHYLEVKKGSVRKAMKSEPSTFDTNQFDLRTDGNLYIN